jgi:hypothetical protein
MTVILSERNNINNFYISITSIFFFLFGVSLAILFYFDFFFSVFFYTLISILLCVYFFFKYKKKNIGPLSLVCIVTFLFSFIHFLPHIIITDFEINPFTLGKGIGTIILYKKEIVELTAMIGVTALSGIAFSISVFNKKINFYDEWYLAKSQNFIKTLPLNLWFVWFFFGLILLIGTTDIYRNIFFKKYVDLSKNFLDVTPSVWFISYVIIIFVIIDAVESSKFLITTKIKRIFLIPIILVISAQLLTGTRESISLILGIILFYYYKNYYIKKKSKFFYVKFLFLISIIFLAGSIIGYIRSDAVGKSFDEIIELIKKYLGIDFFILGTWSAALATVLSVAHDYVDNILNFRWGQDYFDLFLSIPPEFVADFFNYTRPITEYSGPAYEMRYGQGGTHITVLPFRNFGIFGVFIISAIWFSIILYLEKFCTRSFSVLRSSLYVTIITIIPHFLWYSEKNAISAFFIFLILSFFYRISLSISKL